MNMMTSSDRATEIRGSAKPAALRAGMQPFADQARRIAELEELLAALDEIGDESIRKSVARLRRTIADHEPSVTLLGQVKSGKTSLVNAMAGWADLLPADVNPWTSVVTSLHLTPDEEIETGARFRFFTEREWDRLLNKGGRIGEMADRAGAEQELEKLRAQISQMREKSKARLGRKFEMLLGQEHEYGFFDKNLVERYICLGDMFEGEEVEPEEEQQGRFADITKSADLFMHSDRVPTKLCLRDTPGLNDTFMMREQVTIQAIRDSRTCIVVLSAHQALTSIDLAVIRMISNLRARDVLIFVNRIDELAEPGSQIEEIEASIRQTLKDHHGPVDAQILFGSAYWANRVLAGETEQMAPESARSLALWAEHQGESSEEISDGKTWELSGLPALFHALGERIAEDSGKALIEKVSSTAMNMVSNLQMTDTVTVAADADGGGTMSRGDIIAAFDSIAREHMNALKWAFDGLLENFQQRADKARSTFVDRATQSLIAHLEKNGEDPVWEYNPTGLRMLLRSAYNVFGSRVQDAAGRQFNDTGAAIAELYGRAFGDAAAGIEIELPKPPAIAPPVVLGQTIALDFRDGWWKSWWRKTRGYKAFANRFHGLIHAETDAFLVQLRDNQAEVIREEVIAALAEFLDEQRDLIASLADRAEANPEDISESLQGAKAASRLKQLEASLRDIAQQAA